MADDLTDDLVRGTTQDDVIAEGYEDENSNTVDGDANKVVGLEGSDTMATTLGNDLVAGDQVGAEWSLVGGKWVYDASKVPGASEGATSDGLSDDYDYNDTISTGSGDDVLLGNRGNDELTAGSGADIVNAGTGNDQAFGGSGDDVINLDAGDDYSVGGAGADTISGGSGDDEIHGDTAGENLLQGDTSGLTSMSGYEGLDVWSYDASNGDQISQNIGLQSGQNYKVSFEVAANFSGGHSSGKMDVLWNGDVVSTVTANSGIYEKHTVEIEGYDGSGELTFAARQPDPDPDAIVYDTSGLVTTYEKEVTVGGEQITVDAFAPGQSNLYQVIDGQLKIFDVPSNTYIESGANPGFKINAIGFDQTSDLIYGVAKGDGTDALGNPVSNTDIVMIDANGETYRVGEGAYGDYVGDMDDQGNLWSFNASLNRVTVIDVDTLDADGNPEKTIIDLPNSLFKGQIFDISYSSAEGVFYAIDPPAKNGQDGELIRLDLSEVMAGGDPVVDTVPITHTMVDGVQHEGLANAAYGAVFLDADGNIFYGMNRGDHDMDGSTGSTGGVFKLHVDWDGGGAFTEFMSEAPATGSNDGATDPRAAGAFDEVNTEATILIRNPEVQELTSGNDLLLGGSGEDIIYGNEGDDRLAGGGDDDMLYGGDGDDKMMGGDGDDLMDGGIGDDMLKGGHGDDEMRGGEGEDLMVAGQGNDVMYGGEGDDKLFGKDGDDITYGGEGNDRIAGDEGNDQLFGGAGDDRIAGGTGDDQVFGGDGTDKLVGGAGADTLEGGAGDDHLWGGEWSADGSADTFVMSSGGGKDMIHDFEADKDVIDLSSYGVEFDQLQNAMADKGWATEIDLSQLTGGQPGDKLILKSVDADSLDEDNFIL